jgi:hypothetical protein
MSTHSCGPPCFSDGAARTSRQPSLWRPAPSIAVRLDRASPSGHRIDSDITGGGRRHIGRWNVRVVIARHDVGRWRSDRHIARCRRHNNGRSGVNWRSRVNGRRRVRFHNIDALCLRCGRPNQCQRRNCSSQHVVCHGPRPMADPAKGKRGLPASVPNGSWSKVGHMVKNPDGPLAAAWALQTEISLLPAPEKSRATESRSSCSGRRTRSPARPAACGS